MIEAYPLYWPEGWDRTPDGKRKRWAHFKGGMGRYRDDLLAEIKRLGGRDTIISSNVPLRIDGLPRAGAKEPDDAGVAVYFKLRGKPMCFACDQYRFVSENIRAIGLTIAALRGIERWGASDMMERAFLGFAALADKTGRSWRDVLGLEQRVVTVDEIEYAFRRLSKERHPDVGGSAEAFRELVVARDAALMEVSGQ